MPDTYKTSDRQICDNYRGIAPLNVTYKILSDCVLEKVRPWAENLLGDYQAGFKKTDQRQIRYSFYDRLNKTWGNKTK